MSTRRTRSSWGLVAPSRKWFATQTTALTALAVMWATSQGWELEETIAAIGIASQAILAYLLPNAEADAPSRAEVKSRVQRRK